MTSAFITRKKHFSFSLFFFHSNFVICLNNKYSSINWTCSSILCRIHIAGAPFNYARYYFNVFRAYANVLFKSVVGWCKFRLKKVHGTETAFKIKNNEFKPPEGLIDGEPSKWIIYSFCQVGTLFSRRRKGFWSYYRKTNLTRML